MMRIKIGNGVITASNMCLARIRIKIKIRSKTSKMIRISRFCIGVKTRIRNRVMRIKKKMNLWLFSHKESSPLLCL